MIYIPNVWPGSCPKRLHFLVWREYMHCIKYVFVDSQKCKEKLNSEFLGLTVFPNRLISRLWHILKIYNELHQCICLETKEKYIWIVYFRVWMKKTQFRGGWSNKIGLSSFRNWPRPFFLLLQIEEWVSPLHSTHRHDEKTYIDCPIWSLDE